MLTPQDDLIGHQLPTTFDQIDNSDPAWMERLWYTGHPTPSGDLIFEEARIICPACRKAYPVRDDIPVMLIDEAEPWVPGS